MKHILVMLLYAASATTCQYQTRSEHSVHSATLLEKIVASSFGGTATQTKRSQSIETQQTANEGPIPDCEQMQETSNRSSTCKAQNVYRSAPSDQAIPLQRKRSITAEAIERWKQLIDPVLSDDGSWVAYTSITPWGSSERELVIRHTDAPVEYRVSRGFVPRGSFASLHPFNAREKWRRLQFDANSGYLIFSIAPPLSAWKLDERTKSSAPPSNNQSAIGIIDLANGTLTRVLGAHSFSLAPGPSGYISYLIAKRGDDTAGKEGGQGDVLVLRNLSAGTELHFADVSEATFDSKGRYIAYAVLSTLPERNGVYVTRLADGRTVTISRGPGQYQGLTFDEAGQQLAFLSTRDEQERAGPRFSIYLSASPLEVAAPVVGAKQVIGDMMIAADAGIAFSKVGNALTFSVTYEAPESPALPEANYQLWHWRDPNILPSGRERRQASARLAVYYIKGKRWTQLGNEPSSRVLLSNDAKVALSVVAIGPYEDRAYDVNRIDTASGDSRLLRRVNRPVSAYTNYMKSPTRPHAMLDAFALSPSGRYLVYFSEERWWSLNVDNGRVVDLTGSMLPEVRFDERKELTGYTPVAFGIAGWTADHQILVYSENDIWVIDPSGELAARSITDGFADRQRIRFRLWEDFGLAIGFSYLPATDSFLATAERLINIDEPMLLSAFDRNTLASGIWRLGAKSDSDLESLLMVDKRVVPVAKARNAEQYLITQETFSEYPDLWTGSELNDLVRISYANPQQARYRWGSVERVMFTSDFGDLLYGRLYKPEGFDPSKKYAVIVSFYEVHTDDMFHQYAAPTHLGVAPGRIGLTMALSRGYLHFIPDIKAKPPYPGQSAVAAVVPAVNALVERGFVDPNRMCLSGVSYGGYEVNYLVTKTKQFKCAVSYAGVSNLISMYGTIQVPYAVERGQLRQVSSVWERPFAYLENSPLMYADRVDTPILLLHNDEDHSVPFSQGLEFFRALRRNGKRAWLINYLGEGHTLVDKVNVIDWDRRMWEFFDHYLKGSPMPEWMKEPSQKAAL